MVVALVGKGQAAAGPVGSGIPEHPLGAQPEGASDRRVGAAHNVTPSADIAISTVRGAPHRRVAGRLIMTTSTVVSLGSVKKEVQWYLAEALANARAKVDRPGAGDRREVVLAGYFAALSAFKYLEALSEDEERDWHNRMLIALGITPPPPAGPGLTQAVYIGDPNTAPRPDAAPQILPRFMRSVPGPDAEFEQHGGVLRVVAAEIYDTMVAIRWRVAPEPDVFAAFPSEALQLAHDLEGLETWAVDELRQKAEQRLRMMRLYNFELTDDVGTEYWSSGHGQGGGAHGITGEAEFLPAPPATSAKLTLSWLDLAVAIPLQ